MEKGLAGSYETELRGGSPVGPPVLSLIHFTPYPYPWRSPRMAGVLGFGKQASTIALETSLSVIGLRHHHSLGTRLFSIITG